MEKRPSRLPHKQEIVSSNLTPATIIYMKQFKDFLDKKTPSLEDIADKFHKSLEYMKTQLSNGIKIEKEHSSDEKIAREIALDHLNERPDYYERLKKVENDK